MKNTLKMHKVLQMVYLKSYFFLFWGFVDEKILLIITLTLFVREINLVRFSRTRSEQSNIYKH